MDCGRALLVVALALALPVYAPDARAQEASTVAEGLFHEGVALLAKGKIDPACKKLAESEKLDPSTGTALNLADCRQKQGRIATAWEEFLDAARLARKQGRPAAEHEARRRAGLLEPKLSYLDVKLARQVPGTTVQLDSVKLDGAALGSRLPVDPGEHVVTVRAPGYQRLSLRVSIGTPHDEQTLHVPALRRKAASPAAPPGHGAAAADRRTAAGPPLAAYAIGGAGIAALATGGVFVLLAQSAYSDAESQCPSHVNCSQPALDRRHAAEVRANVANVGIGVGLAGVAVGAVLLLLHHENPSRSERSARLVVAPMIGRSRAALAVTGGF